MSIVLTAKSIGCQRLSKLLTRSKFYWLSWLWMNDWMNEWMNEWIRSKTSREIFYDICYSVVTKLLRRRLRVASVHRHSANKTDGFRIWRCDERIYDLIIYWLRRRAINPSVHVTVFTMTYVVFIDKVIFKIIYRLSLLQAVVNTQVRPTHTHCYDSGLPV